MPSLVYFKFKSNLTQQNIPFEGSSISVNDLKSAIRLKNGMKSNDFELILMTTDGKDYNEKDLIPAYSSVIVRRMPVINFKRNNKTINPENFKRNDPYKLMRNNDHGRNLKIINLATSDLTEDQKEDFVAEISSQIYNVPKRVQVGPVPLNYLCNKCNIAGHWIKDCPGIADKDGKMLESKTVKRPSGIPTSNLTEVNSTTPNSYLTSDGRYVVNTRNHEAYLKGKKDKRPFSQEENPPRPSVVDETPSCLLCDLCHELFRDPISTPCCGKVYCRCCAVDTIFDGQSEHLHQCPHCLHTVDVLDSLIDQVLLGDIIRQWQMKRVSGTDGSGDGQTTTAVAAVIGSEVEDDLTDEIFGFSDKENGAADKIMLVNENYVYARADTETVPPVAEKVEVQSRVIPVLSARRSDDRRDHGDQGYRRRDGRCRDDSRSRQARDNCRSGADVNVSRTRARSRSRDKRGAYEGLAITVVNSQTESASIGKEGNEKDNIIAPKRTTRPQERLDHRSNNATTKNGGTSHRYSQPDSTSVKEDEKVRHKDSGTITDDARHSIKNQEKDSTDRRSGHDRGATQGRSGRRSTGDEESQKERPRDRDKGVILDRHTHGRDGSGRRGCKEDTDNVRPRSTADRHGGDAKIVRVARGITNGTQKSLGRTTKEDALTNGDTKGGAVIDVKCKEGHTCDRKDSSKAMEVDGRVRKKDVTKGGHTTDEKKVEEGSTKERKKVDERVKDTKTPSKNEGRVSKDGRITERVECPRKTEGATMDTAKEIMVHCQVSDNGKGHRQIDDNHNRKRSREKRRNSEEGKDKVEVKKHSDRKRGHRSESSQVGDVVTKKSRQDPGPEEGQSTTERSHRKEEEREEGGKRRKRSRSRSKKTKHRPRKDKGVVEEGDKRHGKEKRRRKEKTERRHRDRSVSRDGGSKSRKGYDRPGSERRGRSRTRKGATVRREEHSKKSDRKIRKSTKQRTDVRNQKKSRKTKHRRKH